jgi:hypothetical protein
VPQLLNYLRLPETRLHPIQRWEWQLTSATQLQPKRRARPERNSRTQRPAFHPASPPVTPSCQPTTMSLPDRSLHTALTKNAEPWLQKVPLLDTLETRSKAILHFTSPLPWMWSWWEIITGKPEEDMVPVLWPYLMSFTKPGNATLTFLSGSAFIPTCLMFIYIISGNFLISSLLRPYESIPK